MNDQTSKLPRKPFGYDPAVVDQMLADRDAMLGHAERRIREAEAKVAKLQEQLESRDRIIAELGDRIAELEAASREPRAESPREEPPPLSPKYMTEELSKIIMAAEETTSQILERTWMSTREQILEADRLWREVQEEVVRFAAWRDEAEAVVNSLQEAINQARTRIEAVPQRIQEALAPAVEAMVGVDAGMARFAQASTLPLLVTPSGLEQARARAESMAASPPTSGAGFSDHRGETGGEVRSTPGDEEPLYGETVLAAEAGKELREVQGGSGPGPEQEDRPERWGA